MSLKLIILGKSGLQVLTEVFKGKPIFQKKRSWHLSGPITSWQIGGEKVGTVRDVILGTSKITVTCRHEIKKSLLLG